MKATIKIVGISCVFVLALSIATTSAAAQLNSNVGTVVLNATLPESLTVSVLSGAAVNFTLSPNNANNAGSTTSSIKTSWALSSGRTQVTVWAWVPDGTQALNDSPASDKIPASAVSAAAAGSGSAGGLLSTSASGGAGVPSFITPAGATGVQIGTVTINNLNRASSTTTTLTWNINTTVVPQLPAASYTGTVNIQAQATP